MGGSSEELPPNNETRDADTMHIRLTSAIWSQVWTPGDGIGARRIHRRTFSPTVR